MTAMFGNFLSAHAQSLRLGVALLILASSWLGLRRVVGARLAGQPLRLILLDAAPMMVVWAWLACLVARPLLAAVIIGTMSLGLVFGNAAKKKASNEPLVFADRSQGSIFFYPNLYADAFKGSQLFAGILGMLAIFAALGFMEPPIFSSAWLALPATLLLMLACRLRPTAASFLAWIGERNTARCTFDPAGDARRVGPIAVTILHASIAAVERPVRRINYRPGQSSILPVCRFAAGPIVMIQLESFFDARRVWDSASPDLLPEFDRCVAMSDFHGCLETPAWGANTVRTEFAALTGLPPSALGLDSYNPYLSFARAPVDSIAWRLKAAGYRTVCVHPFSRRFYGRDQVMPNLGFDVFLDIADFAPVAEAGGYMPDARVVEKIDAVLQEYGPKTFVFAITMGNHSPWQRLAPASMAADADGQALEGYLAGLRMTDAALGDMADRLQAQWPDGLLAAFGDHQPSLSQRYGRPGATERATDYLIMRGQAGTAVRRNIAAQELPGLLMDAGAKGRKQFFFEKKNQKTFVPLVHAAGEVRDSA
jgi:hypothetical protein